MSTHDEKMASIVAEFEKVKAGYANYLNNSDPNEDSDDEDTTEPTPNYMDTLRAIKATTGVSADIALAKITKRPQDGEDSDDEDDTPSDVLNHYIPQVLATCGKTAKTEELLLMKERLAQMEATLKVAKSDADKLAQEIELLSKKN